MKIIICMSEDSFEEIRETGVSTAQLKYAVEQQLRNVPVDGKAIHIEGDIQILVV